MNIRPQEAQRTPTRMDPEKLTPRHITTKLCEVGEGLNTSKRKAIRHIQDWLMVVTSLSRNFTGQMAVGWHIQSAERKSWQPRKLYLAKRSFKNEVKTFLDKQKLRAFTTCLAGIPKGVPQGEIKGC